MSSTPTRREALVAALALASPAAARRPRSAEPLARDRPDVVEVHIPIPHEPFFEGEVGDRLGPPGWYAVAVVPTEHLDAIPADDPLRADYDRVDVGGFAILYRLAGRWEVIHAPQPRPVQASYAWQSDDEIGRKMRVEDVRSCALCRRCSFVTSLGREHVLCSSPADGQEVELAARELLPPDPSREELNDAIDRVSTFWSAEFDGPLPAYRQPAAEQVLASV